MPDDKIESLLKEAAILYVEREGAQLTRELLNLTRKDGEGAADGEGERGHLHLTRLDDGGDVGERGKDTVMLQIKRIRRRARVVRTAYIAASLAACFLIAVFGMRLMGGNYFKSDSNTPDNALNVAQNNSGGAGSDVNKPAFSGASIASSIENEVQTSTAAVFAETSTDGSAVTSTDTYWGEPTTNRLYDEETDGSAEAAPQTQVKQPLQQPPQTQVQLPPPQPPQQQQQQPQQQQPLQPPPQPPQQQQQQPPQFEITYLSAKLPAGCVLTKTNYDYEKTVYHIENAYDNDIVLITEPSHESVDADGFIHLIINNTDAYIQARNEYNILLAQSGGVRYTFSSHYEARDLIEIALAVI